MMNQHTKETLVAFERKVADAFLAKQVLAPIHLSGGSEDQIIEVFKDVRPDDYKFSNWRSHYHALLSGIPEDYIFAEVLAGRSMYLSSAKHRFLSSAIVGGILPIACGVALGIKRRHGPEKCFVFIGDMTHRTGIFHEFLQYCDGQQLPVEVVVENNGLSTETPTELAWGRGNGTPVREYRYIRTWPHVGCGTHVTFS